MSIKSQIIILLTERRDLTRYKLAEVLEKPQQAVDIVLCHLRKAGFHIYPSKGPGTPLRIASSASEAAKFVNWRRSRLLGAARLMIMDEVELGRTFEELSASPVELLKIMNSTRHEPPKLLSKDSDK